MARLDLDHHRSQLLGVSDRIRSLSRIPQKSWANSSWSAPFGRFKRAIPPLTLLFFSALFGLWANQQSKSEAIRAWELAHPPSELIWDSALGSREFQKLRNPRLFQQIARTLPAMLDDRNSIWINPESDWIVIMKEAQAREESPETFKIYCLECKNPPQAWNSLEAGWIGFEATLNRIDQSKAARRVRVKPNKIHFAPDPRELRY
jgi:hypothetical protein